MFSHLKLADEIAAEYIIPEVNEIGLVPNLRKINILVGPNNSGKSRLLRGILSRHNRAIPHYSYKKNRDREEAFLRNTDVINWLDSWQGSELVKSTRKTKSTFLLEAFFDLNFGRVNRLNTSSFDYLLNLGLSQPRNQNKKDRLPEANFRSFVAQRIQYIHQEILTYSDSEEKSSDYSSFYIPSVRGLRPLLQGSELIATLTRNGSTKNDTISSSYLEHLKFLFGETPSVSLTSFFDFYTGATKRDYPSLKKDNVTVFSGLTIYEDIKKLLLGTQEERERVKLFEDFLSQNFFENDTVELTPNIKTPNILHVRLGSHGKDLPIHNLGDGIQSIISLLYPVFTQLDPNRFYFVGIEEPEIHLHPGLQRQLISALKSIVNAQFFITTHSNHLLETIWDDDDTSIYRIKKDYLSDDDKRRKHTSIQHVRHSSRELLQDLGIVNTSVFLTNCTIWVEGITDRLLFRHYLELYSQEHHSDSPPLVEGKHFSFVEYGGSNLSHWIFDESSDEGIDVNSLCGEGLLIVDDDNAKGAKKDKQEQLEDALGPRFLSLPCKELENLLTPEILEKIVSDYSADGSTFRLGSQWATYQSKALGKFLDERIAKKGFKLKRKSTFAEGNTVRDKVKFVRKAIEHTSSISLMSQAAIDVTKKIHEFILLQNSSKSP